MTQVAEQGVNTEEEIASMVGIAEPILHLGFTDTLKDQGSGEPSPTTVQQHCQVFLRGAEGQVRQRDQKAHQ